MNNNEAIALLQRAADRADAMLEMAQLTVTDARAIAKLLKEQEPVKPELRMTKHGFRQWIVCGNCHGKIYGGDDYCRHCGKPVKWKQCPVL